VVLRCSVLQRDVDQQRGTAASRAHDFDRPAQRLDAVAEPDRSRPPGGVGAADPFVADLYSRRVALGLDCDCGAVGAGVLDSIRERLADDE
jgi:hypothetical protein